MKKLFGAILVLGSLSTFAHPDVRDSLDMTGTGSKLIAKSDLNIKPNSLEFYLGQGQSKDRKCYLILKKSVAHDRVISAEKELIVTSTRRYFDADAFFPRKVELTVNHPEVKNISCESIKTYTSIEEFTTIAANSFELVLAEPSEL